MKKFLSTSLVLLFIIGGLTVAYAAGALSNDAVIFAAPGAAAATENDGTGAKADADETMAAADTTGTAVTTSNAAVTGGAVTTDEAIDAEVSTDAAVTVVPDMTFTGTPISLSLEDAYEKMLADSPSAKMAELNRKSADGVAKGYSETSQKLEDNTAGKNMLEINKKYARIQGPKNYEAEMNQLKQDTLENYYTLKELENQVSIAKENLSLKEKLLSNTQLKYNLGTVSKQDVLQAEIAVNEAKDQYMLAENGLNSMKMGFNQFMGYGLMQNVTLTDTINEIPLSEKSLSDSVKDALANRNEIFEAAYSLEVANRSFKSVSYYPKNSSTYIGAEMAKLMAETGNKNAPLTVESDVRNKYMDMIQKQSAVQTGKKSVDNAKETTRLAQLQYDAGLATLSDVQGAQLGYTNAQLALSKSLLQYNLAVNAYELASGIGTHAAAIK